MNNKISEKRIREIIKEELVKHLIENAPESTEAKPEDKKQTGYASMFADVAEKVAKGFAEKQKLDAAKQEELKKKLQDVLGQYSS